MVKSKVKSQKSKPQFKIQNFKFCLLVLPFYFLVFSFLTGCEQIGKEDIDKIVQEDASFKEVLNKKQDLDSKIALLSNQLRELKSMTDANIRSIQENFNKQRGEIDAKIASLKKELEPQRLKIRQEIDSLKGVVSAKKGMLRSLENTKNDLLKLINQQKAVDVTTEDMSKWQERLADLNKQIEPAAGEVRELEEKLRSLKIKLMVLRQ